MSTKQTEALKLALGAICGSGDFLFNWHDCEPNNEREMQQYQATLAANENAFRAIREALAEQPARQEQGDSNCQDADGCPTEMAVLQRFWRGEPIPAEHYPVWFKPAQCPHDFLIGDDEPGHDSVCMQCGATVPNDEQPAQPSKPLPLTDEQIMEMYNEPRSDAEMIEFARAIEAAHGIKGDA